MAPKKRTKADKTTRQTGSRPRDPLPRASAPPALQVWDRRLLAVLAMHAVWETSVDAWVDNDRIDLCLPEEVVRPVADRDRERLYRRSAGRLKRMFPSHYEEQRDQRRRVRRLRHPLPPRLQRWLEDNGPQLIRPEMWRRFDEDRVGESGIRPPEGAEPPSQAELFQVRETLPSETNVVFLFPDGEELEIPLGATFPGRPPSALVPPATMVVRLLDVSELLIQGGDPPVWRAVHGLLLHAEGALEHQTMKEDLYRRARYYLERGYLFYLVYVQPHTDADDAHERVDQLRHLLRHASVHGADRDLSAQARRFELEGLASQAEAMAFKESPSFALQSLEDADAYFRRALTLWEASRGIMGICRCKFGIADVAATTLRVKWAMTSEDGGLQYAVDTHLDFLDMRRSVPILQHQVALACASLADLLATGAARRPAELVSQSPRQQMREAITWLGRAYKTRGPADTPTVFSVDQNLGRLATLVGVEHRPKSEPPPFPPKERIRISMRIQMPYGTVEKAMDEEALFSPQGRDKAARKGRG